MPLWPLSKISHLLGLSPNLLFLRTDPKTQPCTPASLQLKHRSFRPKLPFLNKIPFLLPNIFPWIIFTFYKFSTLRIFYPSSCKSNSHLSIKFVFGIHFSNFSMSSHYTSFYYLRTLKQGFHNPKS